MGLADINVSWLLLCGEIWMQDKLFQREILDAVATAPLFQHVLWQ